MSTHTYNEQYLSLLLLVHVTLVLVMIDRDHLARHPVLILCHYCYLFLPRYMLHQHSAGIRSVVDDEAGKSDGGLRSDPMCNACEMAVVWMQNQLAQNKTKELILNYINQVSLRTFFNAGHFSTT